MTYKEEDVKWDAEKAQQVKTPVTVDTILNERGSRYGSFRNNARISQTFSRYLREEHEARISRGQLPLQYHELEALEMIFHKAARILSGDDSTYADNWDDIAGYAQPGKVPR